MLSTPTRPVTISIASSLPAPSSSSPTSASECLSSSLEGLFSHHKHKKNDASAALRKPSARKDGIKMRFGEQNHPSNDQRDYDVSAYALRRPVGEMPWWIMFRLPLASCKMRARIWMTIPGETRKGAEGAKTLRQKDRNPTILWRAGEPAPTKQALRGQSFR